MNIRTLNRGFRRTGALALVLTVTPLLIACGDDNDNNGGTGPGASDYVGTWSATSFIVDGTDIVAAGTSISFTFTESAYSFSVANDQNSTLCDPGILSCAENGDLSSTETTLTFDPGSADAVTVNYQVTGDVMTIAGTVNGSTLSAAFQKQ